MAGRIGNPRPVGQQPQGPAQVRPRQRVKVVVAGEYLRLLGLLPTLYRVGSFQSEAVVSEMRKVFKGKVTRTAIPFDDAASAAPAVRKSVLDYAPESPAARAYRELAVEILDQVSLPNRMPSILRPSRR